jgi:hypothetical protein
MTTQNLTQQRLEVLYSPIDRNHKLTQQRVEAIYTPSARPHRLTQMKVEALYYIGPAAQRRRRPAIVACC